MTATTLTSPDAAAAPPPRDVPLKTRLKRAERRKKLLHLALIAPLAVFLLVVFLWPIGALLKRSVDNPEVSGGLPATSTALEHWNGQGLPEASTLAVFVKELEAARGTTGLASAAKRLNTEMTGYRSLIMKTARAMPLPEGSDLQAGLTAIDLRWGEALTWQVMARAGKPYTSYYLLAALDHKLDADGAIIAATEDQAIYLDVLGRTFWMSLVVTLCCLALGFPLAYLLTSLPTRSSNLLMILVLLPFWTSILVRVASWIVLLQSGGLVNQALQALGIIDEPLQLVFNRIGVYIAMTHILLPFMILPLYSVMKGISPIYLRAAQSLGCPPFQSFWKVYFPQTLPGVFAGSLLVFILSMGYYITPALLGGPQEQMASYFIAFYTNETINWGMAAALSTVLLGATLLLYVVYSRYAGQSRTPIKTR